MCLFMTCSAVALSRVLRTALVPYGNKETSTSHRSKTFQVLTMKLCTFDYVRQTNTFAKFGWNPPTRVAPCVREIYTSCDFFLPACLFLLTCSCRTDREYFAHNCSKNAVWRRRCIPTMCCSPNGRFGDQFAQKPSKCRPVGKSQSNKKVE